MTNNEKQANAYKKLEEEVLFGIELFEENSKKYKKISLLLAGIGIITLAVSPLIAIFIASLAFGAVNYGFAMAKAEENIKESVFAIQKKQPKTFNKTSSEIDNEQFSLDYNF